MPVSIIKRDNYTNPIKSAIERCNGFSALKPDHNVLSRNIIILILSNRPRNRITKIDS